jgi:hypothetical protein
MILLALFFMRLGIIYANQACLKENIRAASLHCYFIPTWTTLAHHFYILQIKESAVVKGRTLNNIENSDDYNDRLMTIFSQIPEIKIQSMARFYLKKNCSNPRAELLKGLWGAKVRNGDDRDLYNLLEIFKFRHLIENRNDYHERLVTIFSQIPEVKIKSMARFYLKKKCSDPLEELIEGLWIAKVRNGDDRDLRKLLKIFKFSDLNPSNSLVVPISQSHSAFFSSRNKQINNNNIDYNNVKEECRCRLF